MITTNRLDLIRFEPQHLAPFIAMNADPEVMAHFPAPMPSADSEAYFTRIQTHWQKRGFGLLAVTRRDSGAFIGFTGLTNPAYETTFTPCVEIGWRFTRAAWGKGYAFEAAQACLRWGFDGLGLDEIVSFTARENLRSHALMRRLAMKTNTDEDFEHPMLEIGHRLSWHVLYRIAKP